MPPDPDKLDGLTPDHRRLVLELGTLRERVPGGLRPFGNKAGMAFSRVRRIEAGEVMPSVAEVRAWLAAAGVDDPIEIERIVDLAGRAHTRTSEWATRLKRERSTNPTAAAWEQASHLICSYQHHIIPGLLATHAYAAALLPHLPVKPDPAEHLAGQMRRQDILHATDHRFRFVITEWPWLWSPDPDQPDLMPAQHDRIVRVDELPNVDVRLLDHSSRVMADYSANFTLYDERASTPPFVNIEFGDGGWQLREPEDVEKYRQRFARMWETARPVGEEPP